MTARARLALAAASGLLYWAACPPWSLWPLALVCWAPLLVALRGATARQALAIGGLQGLVTNLALAVWLPAVVASFAPLHPATCWAITGALCAYNAVGVALVAWVSARGARNGWSGGATFVLALAVKETFYPLLFPVVAALQVVRAPALVQLAELGGPALVGVPLALANVGAAEIAAALLARRPARWRLVALAGAAPLAAALFGLWRMASVDAQSAAAPVLRVAIVQANTPHAGTTLRDAIDAHLAGTGRAVADGTVDLVVWPETAIAGVFAAGEVEQALRRDVVPAPEAAPLPAPVLSGVMLQHGRAYANSAVLFDPDGAVHGTYDKVHPLVFGEYLPLGDRFPALRRWMPNAGRLTAGPIDQPPLALGGHRVSALICYEDLLPDYVNAVARRARPELLVNLTNDSWFGDSTAAATHFAMATLRAVEHRRWLVVASNSGVSGFVDPSGRPSGETPLLEAATRTAVVRWLNDAPTLYERVGDAPWWGAACLVGAAALVGRRGRRAAARELPPSACDEGRREMTADRGEKIVRAERGRDLGSPHERGLAGAGHLG